MPLRSIAALVPFAILEACPVSPGPAEPAAPPADEAATVEAPAYPTCAEERRGATLNVVEVGAPEGSPWWSCPFDPQYDEPECACIDGYLGLATRAAQYREPVSAEALAARLAGIRPGGPGSPFTPDLPMHTEALPAGELADRLLEATGSCFLHEGIDERALTVHVTAERDLAGYREQHLIFDDPFIGRFEGILLLPPGDGPFPGVVALHGHGDDAREWLDLYHGDWLPGGGIAVLALTLRGMCVDENEDLAARTLLLAGTSVLGVRGYEAALGRKYLDWLPEVDGARIGLIGHSTGSAAGNVVVRTVPGFAGYVSDLQDNYFTYVDNPLFSDVMSPDTFLYHPLINDFSTSIVPILEVGYGYSTLNEDDPSQPNDLPEIIEFFNRVTLRP